MHKTLVYSGLFMLLCGAPGAGAQTNACADTETTEIYFVNGTWNSYAQARSKMVLVRDAYKESLEAQYPGQVFEFKMGYNHSDGIVQDVLEVIRQKLDEIDDLDARQLTPKQYLLLFMTANEFEDEVPEAAKPLANTIADYYATRATESETATALIRKNLTDLQEGRRVLLISHSQGNLFANQSVAALMNTYGGNIGMVSVATPTALTYNNSPYYTAHDDLLINLIRTVFNVLPSNVDNDPGFFNDRRDFTKHHFVESYFAEGLASRTKIDEAVARFMADLRFPAPLLGSGALTVTLTLDGQAGDADLRITEPGGILVSRANPQGLYGMLDLSDSGGSGPEHYFVACDAVAPGDYRVAVDYAGAAGLAAMVQVTTGDGHTRVFSQPLTGDASPTPVATVTVSEDDNGQVAYEVMN